MALTRSTDPLVWIDCEMTGLNPSHDTILSLSCFITTATLEFLDPHGFHAIIHHTPLQLSRMSPWCISQHSASGLTQSCLDASPTTATATRVSSDLLGYIKHHIPKPGIALLAGNSIHADRGFLMQGPWKPLVEYLHYRLFDVSSCKEMVRRWCGVEVLEGVPRKEGRHMAKEDVLESIEEARFYMGLFGGLKMPEEIGSGKEEGEEGEGGSKLGTG